MLRLNLLLSPAPQIVKFCHTGQSDTILIFDIRALWRSAKLHECQKLKTVGVRPLLVLNIRSVTI